MPQSFLEVARELIDQPEAKAAFAEDPPGFLAARGLDGFSGAELEDAVSFVADAVPVLVARQLAGPSPDAAPEPGALAQLAAATAVEQAVREAEPGTVDLAAVLDPGGELGVPDPIDFGTVVPTAGTSGGEDARAGEDAVDDEGADSVDAPGADSAVTDHLVDTEITDIEDTEIEHTEEEEGQELAVDAVGDPFPPDDLAPGLADGVGSLPGDPFDDLA